jgi:hypothetical protein
VLRLVARAEALEKAQISREMTPALDGSFCCLRHARHRCVAMPTTPYAAVAPLRSSSWLRCILCGMRRRGSFIRRLAALQITMMNRPMHARTMAACGQVRGTAPQKDHTSAPATSRGSQFSTTAAACPITSTGCQLGHECDAPHRLVPTASCLNGHSRRDKIGPSPSAGSRQPSASIYDPVDSPPLLATPNL